MNLHKLCHAAPTRHLQWVAAAATSFLTFGAGALHAQGVSPEDSERRCGPVATPAHYGPFDYRTQRPALAVVERHHFTPAVETLTGGASGNMERDLSYTLKSSPNHHRALLAVVNLAARTKSPQPGQLEYSIECWFDRAIRYRPDDNIVRMIFADYLVKAGRAPEARQQLDVATKAAEDNPLTHHNIGLVYFEMGQYELALARAHEARKLGFQKSRLETLLKQKGTWKDPQE